jgi:hypothetical protein
VTSLRLPPLPRVELPELPEKAARAWEERTSRARALSRGAGAGSHFHDLVVEAKRILELQDLATLRDRRGDRRFVRAVATAWGDDPHLARATLTPEVILMLSEAAWSRLGTLTIAHLLLEHFDHVERWRPGTFTLLRDLVGSALAKQRAGRREDTIEALRGNQTYILHLDGPVRLAAELGARSADVAEWLRVGRLSGFADTRWGRVVRDAYYLERIRAANPESGNHDFLTAVTSTALTRQRTEETEQERLYFGHQVLTAMTGKPTRHPSDAWRDAVLTIAGDPRLEQTEQWRTWWSRVPEENRRRAIRWMQGLDLRAFLLAVAHYAESTFNDPMQRMLERRAQLLTGLYEQDRIEDLRLILGSTIRDWIRKEMGFIPVDAARLEGSPRETAVVYVNCGDFHLIEGSHNFKLQVYVGAAPEQVGDRRRRYFTLDDLREDIPAMHARIHGPYSFGIFAHQGLKWIQDALDFLQHRGVRVDERALLTANDFATLARRRAGWY